VLVDDDGDAKVTDFGIARSAALDDGLTDSGVVLGTSHYIAPEQATGGRVDERSDQYSLGALLFELLTGDVPYPGESMVEVAMRHVQDPVPSVRERRPDVPPRVDALVQRAMAKRPEDRFPSMDALIAALEASIATEGTEDPEATQVIRPSRPRRRRRRVPFGLLAGLLVLAAAAVAVWALATGRFSPGNESGSGGAAVPLAAVGDYDPLGDDAEHPELLEAATDGDPVTWWRTETYADFQGTKEGVGIVLDAGRRRELGEIAVRTDTPGFEAVIQAGNSPEGEFAAVSQGKTVEERTVFELDGGAYRYYVIWITNLEEVAHVNEVTARG
jgi:serine/threonine-protein kinase